MRAEIPCASIEVDDGTCNKNIEYICIIVNLTSWQIRK